MEPSGLSVERVFHPRRALVSFIEESFSATLQSTTEDVASSVARSSLTNTGEDIFGDGAGESPTWGPEQEMIEALEALRAPRTANTGRTRPPPAAYNRAMGACAAATKWEEALEVLRAMRVDRVRPDAQAMNATVSACAKVGQWEQALHLLHRMHVSQIEPNSAAYNAAIGACAAHLTSWEHWWRDTASQGCWETMLGLIRDMKELRLEPTIESYTEVINICEVTRQMDQAKQLRQDLTDQHFMSMLHASETRGRWEKALSLLDTMRNHGAGPIDEEAHAAAIGAAGRRGNWAQALAVLSDMKRNGITPRALAYGKAMDACSRASRWEEVLRLFAEVRLAGEEPGEATRSIAMEARARVPAETKGGNGVTVLSVGNTAVGYLNGLGEQCSQKPGRSAVEIMQMDLRRLLRQKGELVTNLFHQWDTNKDGQLSKAEFVEGVLSTGIVLDNANGETREEMAEALFLAFDEDCSGFVDFWELHKFLRSGRRAKIPRRQSVVAIAPTPSTTPRTSSKERVRKRPPVLHALSEASTTATTARPWASAHLSASPSRPPSPHTAAKRKAGPSQEELRNALTANWPRVKAIFREWDIAATGRLTRAEFRRLLVLLNIHGLRNDLQADAVFDAFDTDGTGEVSFRDLDFGLRPGRVDSLGRKAPAKGRALSPVTAGSGGGAAPSTAGRTSPDASLPSAPCSPTPRDSPTPWFSPTSVASASTPQSARFSPVSAPSPPPSYAPCVSPTSAPSASASARFSPTSSPPSPSPRFSQLMAQRRGTMTPTSPSSSTSRPKERHLKRGKEKQEPLLLELRELQEKMKSMLPKAQALSEEDMASLRMHFREATRARATVSATFEGFSSEDDGNLRKSFAGRRTVRASVGDVQPLVSRRFSVQKMLNATELALLRELEQLEEKEEAQQRTRNGFVES